MPAGLSPGEIRSLRGARTRAAFADEVGVNAHTIYRWELPETSPHARRPRGAALARLRDLAARLPDAAAVPIAAAVERLLDGDWQGEENTLLRALADRDTRTEARALAATGLALIDLVYRADGRRALAALGPALAAPPTALTEATAALAYSMPDGELFDLGLVHAHAQRAAELGPDSVLAQALSAMAVANAALLGGDDDLLMRALHRVDAIASAALPEIPALFLEQLRSYEATMAGQNQLAMQRLERLLEHPRIGASANLEARVCAARAMRMLDSLGDPAEALALARRARTVAAEARVAIGVHTALALRSEAEALLRLGRIAEAGRVFDESDRIFGELRFPVTIILPVQARYLLVTNRADELDALATRVGAVTLPSIRAVCQAYAAYLHATAEFARGADPGSTMAAFEQADRLASGWGFLRRDLLVSYATAALVDGTTAEARALLDRAQRAADRRPSAWTTAHLRRAEGTLLVGEGRIEEGRTMLEAASATFAASGDRLGAALTRYGIARLGHVLGDPDGDAQLATARAEMTELGLPDPAWVDRAMRRAQQAVASAARPRRAPAAALLSPALELALQRIAVAGATPEMVVRELAAVARELAGVPVVIDEEREAGPYRVCGDAGMPVAWFDLGAVAGRRLRLGTLAEPGDAARAALRVLVVVSGLAVQVATLRGGERANAPPELVPDVPGLVVASAAMRRLIGDVQRLAGSRATVTITGESGAGKEVIARALHELSPRAARPYVAFNCTAVPHDLFEGQLFGYRKGAFTGATADHAGVIRAADHGTLFLDEIGELPLDIQPKLLRFLDAGEVFPLGAARAANVDVRVIAATNRDLASEVARGRFRQDLFYRLHVVPLVVPPLRERRDDIVPLARHFARVLAGDRRAPTFAPDALVALREHGWPGNVRELRNVIERAMAYAGDGVPGVLSRAELGL